MDMDEFDFRDNQRNRQTNNSDLRNEAQQLLQALSQAASTASSLGKATKMLAMLSSLPLPIQKAEDQLCLTTSGLLPQIQLIESFEPLQFV